MWQQTKMIKSLFGGKIKYLWLIAVGAIIAWFVEGFDLIKAFVEAFGSFS